MSQPDHDRDRIIWEEFCRRPNASLTLIARHVEAETGEPISGLGVSGALTRIFHVQMGERKHDILINART